MSHFIVTLCGHWEMLDLKDMVTYIVHGGHGRNVVEGPGDGDPDNNYGEDILRN